MFWNLPEQQADNGWFHDDSKKYLALLWGVQQGYILGSSTTGATNFDIISLPLYLENVTAGATFEFEIENITNNDDPIVRSSVFYLYYLHDN